MWRTFMMILIVGSILSSCHLQTEFELASESRLPRWFTLPSNYSRGDLTVTITYINYIPSHPKVKMVLYGPFPEHNKLIEKKGTVRWHPVSEGKYDVYPNYSIITVDGIEEVFVQRKRNDILYISDDPKLKKY